MKLLISKSLRFCKAVLSLIRDGSFTPLVDDRVEVIRQHNEDVEIVEIKVAVASHHDWIEPLEYITSNTHDRSGFNPVDKFYADSYVSRYKYKRKLITLVLIKFINKPSVVDLLPKALALAKYKDLKLTYPQEAVALLEDCNLGQYSLLEKFESENLELVVTSPCTLYSQQSIISIRMIKNLSKEAEVNPFKRIDSQAEINPFECAYRHNALFLFCK